MSNWQYHSIGLDNGSVLYRRQAFIWTNADAIQHVKAALGGDALNIWQLYLNE